MVGLEHPLEVGRHAFSCGDSLPAWAWNLEDRNVSESAPWKRLDLPTEVLKGQSSQDRICSGGSLVTSGLLMNDIQSQDLNPRTLPLDPATLLFSSKGHPQPLCPVQWLGHLGRTCTFRLPGLGP